MVGGKPLAPNFRNRKEPLRCGNSDEPGTFSKRELSGITSSKVKAYHQRRKYGVRKKDRKESGLKKVLLRRWGAARGRDLKEKPFRGERN